MSGNFEKTVSEKFEFLGQRKDREFLQMSKIKVML